MKYRQLVILFMIMVVSLHAQCGSDSKTDPILVLDPNPPQKVAKVFASGTISTFMDDWAIRFSPEGKEVYFTVTGRNQATIVSMKWKQGKWSSPEVLSFSGRYFDYAPVLSHDGKYLVFASFRPVMANEEKSDPDLWIAKRKNSGWGVPSHLPFGINTPGKNDTWPSLDSRGNLYFSSNREGGEGQNDLYVSRLVGNIYQQPENMGKTINSELGEYCPFIAPDGSYIIYEVVDKPGGLGGGDMYISVKLPNGTWRAPQNMGSAINSSRHDCYPCLSPNGRYLFFMSDRRSRTPRKSEKKLQYEDIVENARKQGGWDIYWIDAKILDQYLK